MCPNILFITTDQQRRDCYGFRGRKVQTPHLDALVERGTDFRNCITPSPVCQPARAAILTGLLPFTSGAADNGIDLDPDLALKGFAGNLSRAGYQTALVGKAHFSTKATFSPTGRAECATSSADYPPDWTGPYMGFEHVELALFGKWFPKRDPLYPPNGQHFEKWFFDGVGRTNGYDLWRSETRPTTGAHQTWNSALPVAWHPTSWIGDRSIDFIKSRKKDKSFMLWTSFGDPHHPFDCPEPWASLHDPEKIDLPQHRELDLEQRPWWHKAALEGEPKLDDPVLKRFRKSGTRVLDQSEEQLRDMTANYYGMISLIDHNVGRILAALEEEGELENTYIFFTSDHGDFLGDHGLYLKGPMLYESLINVGLIAVGPGIPAGRSESAVVSTLDMAPTFADIAKSKPDTSWHGDSILPILGGEVQKRSNPVLCEWRVGESRCGVPLRLTCVHDGRYKLTFDQFSEAGELYDLGDDPNEMRNLWGDPTAKNIQIRLMTILSDRRKTALEGFAEPVGMT